MILADDPGLIGWPCIQGFGADFFVVNAILDPQGTKRGARRPLRQFSRLLLVHSDAAASASSATARRWDWAKGPVSAYYNNFANIPAINIRVLLICNSSA